MAKQTIFVPKFDNDDFVKILEKSNSLKHAESTAESPSIAMTELKIIELLLAPPITKKIWKYQSYHQSRRSFQEVKDVIHMEQPK